MPVAVFQAPTKKQTVKSCAMMPISLGVARLRTVKLIPSFPGAVFFRNCLSAAVISSGTKGSARKCSSPCSSLKGGKQGEKSCLLSSISLLIWILVVSQYSGPSCIRCEDLKWLANAVETSTSPRCTVPLSSSSTLTPVDDFPHPDKFLKLRQS